jgi:hypothetical protein
VTTAVTDAGDRRGDQRCGRAVLAPNKPIRSQAGARADPVGGFLRAPSRAMSNTFARCAASVSVNRNNVPSPCVQHAPYVLRGLNCCRYRANTTRPDALAGKRSPRQCTLPDLDVLVSLRLIHGSDRQSDTVRAYHPRNAAEPFEAGRGQYGSCTREWLIGCKGSNARFFAAKCMATGSTPRWAPQA